METREEHFDQNFHFPEEIFLEILVKLPPKSIFMFKCVSKKWLSLISGPSFFPSYISQSKASFPFKLIFQCDNHKGIHCFISSQKILENFTASFPFNQIPRLKVVATSNDLVLYQSYSQELVYFVANSFTREFVTLPMHSVRKCYGRMGLISRVSNGITSYNVVRIVKTSDNGVFSCNFEILSSEKGEWRIVKPENDTFNAEFDMRSSVLYKGNLHWICNKMTTILAYDPFKNECRFISIPSEVYHMKGKNAILGVSRDNLCYFEMNRISINECKLPGWKMWVMKDYEKGDWSLDHEEKERKIEGISVICNVLSGYSPIIPVSFHPWNEEIVYFWYEGYVFTYNVKKGWFEDDFVAFSSQSIVLMWEMFPLLMPFCPSKLPKPKWDGKVGNIVNIESYALIKIT